MQGRNITLPEFSGVTRQIVLSYLGAFFGLALLIFALPHQGPHIQASLALLPLAVVHGHLWQLFTYTYYPAGVLNTLFGLLTIWFTAATLENLRGRRWVAELFYVTVIGGGILATLAAFAHIPLLRPDVPAIGMWSLVFGLLVAFGTLFADVEILLFFILRIKAKYLILIYILIDAAILVRGGDAMDIAVRWSSGLCAYLFVRFIPARGLTFKLSEGYFGLRNQYFRRKRRRAARKFEVYMRKQDRVVHFDSEGRYIEPEEEKRDPNSRKWMN